MGLFSKFENKAEDVIEGSTGSGKGGIEPVKLAKRAYKEMQHEKMVGVGHEYAPTLYNVLVSAEDDAHMSGYYPSLAGEIESYLTGRASSSNLVFDCPPLVRFIVDDGLKRGRFDIIAENVSPAIIDDLRKEELEHYGIEEPEPDYNEQPYGTPAYEPNAYKQPSAYEEERLYQPEVDQRPDFQPAYEPQEEPASQQASAYQQPVYEQPQQEAYQQPAYEQAQPNYAQPAAPQQQGYPQAAPAAAPRQYPPTKAPLANEPIPTAAPQQQSAAAESADATMLINNATISTGAHASLLDYSTRERYPLIGNRIIIGRGSSCDIRINDPSVSRHHAEILHDEAGWLIRDTGSTNGTSINANRASQSRIYNGDIITLGTAELEFQEG